MEEFKYDSDKTRSCNFARWKRMNDEERILFNDPLYTKVEAMELFDKLYPMEHENV